jgi:hypothetical protein
MKKNIKLSSQNNLALKDEKKKKKRRKKRIGLLEGEIEK